MRFLLAFVISAMALPGLAYAQAPPPEAPPDLSAELLGAGVAPAAPAAAKPAAPAAAKPAAPAAAKPAAPAIAPPAAAKPAAPAMQNAVTTTQQQTTTGTDGRSTNVTTTTVQGYEPSSAAEEMTFSGDENDALLLEYKGAYELFQAKKIPEAKDIFKKVAEKSTKDELTANALFLLANCYVRMGEYESCVKAIQQIANKYPHTGIVQKGQLLQFATNIINRATQLQTSWDYWRYQDGVDENDKPVWKESVPPGQKIVRINFRLPFGVYKALHQTQPNNPYTVQAKVKLDSMLSIPITFAWIDEKAKLTPWGHPSDFFSKLGIREMKHFSNVICERMFYEWKTDKFYLVLKMYDDVRNLKHRYTAKGAGWEEKPVVSKDVNGNEVVLKPGVKVSAPVFSLAKLFEAAAYDPFTDTFGSATESVQPADLGL